MKLYLARHGKSNAREVNKRQSPSSPLSEEGKKQASALAKRMAKEKIDVIISSKWDRAYQTAEIVSKKLKIKLETIEGIHEKEQNPKLEGVSFESDVHKRYTEEIEKYEKNLNWKFDGEGESTRDLINRARIFQRHLIENHKDQDVLIVSHGLFIRAFVILALLGEDYDDNTFYRIYTSISTSNAGVTLLEYIPIRKHWELVYLNDHLHIS